jgi:uncharacterized protein (DUF1501 family)
VIDTGQEQIMVTRRLFLRDGGLAVLSLGFAPAFLARTAAAATRRTLLVAIFQRGAVDGLNMVVPFAERDYYRLRPSIAVPRPGGDGSALDLDGFFGFHPRLQPLKAFYDRGELAVVHACGSPDHTRSHFDAQDYMESGTPGIKRTEDGWLNRTLAARRAEQSSPFRAVALAPALPRSLQGKASALAIGQISQFGVRDGRGGTGMGTSFEEQYAAAADTVLQTPGREAFDAIKLLKRADPARYQPAARAAYPRSSFGQALKQIAQLAKAGVGLEIAFAETGNWDHHVNEGSTEGLLAARLDDFARGIAAFVTDLGDGMRDTVVVTMSEFGRALAENGSRGTDHGHGNAMLVMGAGVKGGRVYGRWPGLSREQLFEGRDLEVTTDFRDVFAEIVVRHLGVADPSPIFPGYEIRQSKRLGLMA